MLAAKAGASFISFFVGRVDDMGSPEAMPAIADAVNMVHDYSFPSNPEILVASIRSPYHIVESIKGWRADRHRALQDSGAAVPSSADRPRYRKVRRRLPEVAEGSRERAFDGRKREAAGREIRFPKRFKAARIFSRRRFGGRSYRTYS